MFMFYVHFNISLMTDTMYNSSIGRSVICNTILYIIIVVKGMHNICSYCFIRIQGHRCMLIHHRTNLVSEQLTIDL